MPINRAAEKNFQLLEREVFRRCDEHRYPEAGALASGRPKDLSLFLCALRFSSVSNLLTSTTELIIATRTQFLQPQFPTVNHARLPPHRPLNPSNQIKFLPPPL